MPTGSIYTVQKWKRYTFAFCQNGRKAIFISISFFVNREYVYIVAVYQKYLTRLGELKSSSLGEKIIISPELDSFDIRQQFVRILLIFQQSRLLSFIISNTVKRELEID